MSEEKPRHPLEEKRKGHPLDEAAPPPSAKPKRQVAIRLPGTVEKPYVTYALLAINVLIFIFITAAPQAATPFFMETYVAPDKILGNREFYRLITGMFLHVEMAHMAFNMLALYYIGANVERVFGHLRFSLIYFLGGLLGSIFMLFTGSNGIGASGAIFAVWGAEVIFLYRHRKLFGSAATARLRNSAILMIFNFLFGFGVNTLGDISGQGTIRIANEAHLGGLLGGLILAWFISPYFVAEAAINPDTGQQFIRVTQQNLLKARVNELLFFCCGLAALILLAIFLRT